MKYASWFLGLLVFAHGPADAATAQGSMDVRFVVAETCVIRLQTIAPAPAIACNSPVPRYIFERRVPAGAEPANQERWTIYF